MRTLASGLLGLSFLFSPTAHAQQCEYPISDLTKCTERTARPGHVATVSNPPCGPNGSTVIGALAPQGYGVASFKPACSDHDLCYERCNSVKAQCDAAFNATMEASCDSAFPSPASGEDEEFMRRGACRSRAHLYVRLVAGSSVGQTAYDDAQKIACECCTGWRGTISYVRDGSQPLAKPAYSDHGGTCTDTGTVTISEITVFTYGASDTDPNHAAMTASSIAAMYADAATQTTACTGTLACGGTTTAKTLYSDSYKYTGAVSTSTLPQQPVTATVAVMMDGSYTIDTGFLVLPGIKGVVNLHTVTAACQGSDVTTDTPTDFDGSALDLPFEVSGKIDQLKPTELAGSMKVMGQGQSVGGNWTVDVTEYTVTWNLKRPQ